MSKFKTTFTLKQHTPIIHFQSGQHGATLRATELKPKFDKFLKKYAFDGKIPDEFLIPQQENALDYKVKISTIGEIEKNLPNNFLYFANNAIKDNNEKTYMLKAQSIKVEFFSFKTKLLEIIKEYFEEFMLVTNFGARATKGYGSFCKSTKETQKILKKYYPIIFKIQNPNIQRWEEKVDTIHKLLKAGINFRSYHKSLLFQYMCTKNLRWEKRKIKEEFPQVATGKPPIDCDVKKEYRYIRAMLGLAGINEFAVGRERHLITISHKGEKIERFASPITYKIIDNNIYLLCDRSYEKIMDETFVFSFRGKSFEIKTPSKEEFDLYEFLHFVQEKENIISEIKK